MSDPFGVSESSNLSGGIDYPVIDLPAVDLSNINFDELNLGLSPEDLNAIFSDPNLLSNFANVDPESAALLKGLVDPLYTPPDSGESAESETRGTNTTGSDISELTDTEKNKILTTPFGSVPATGVKGVLQQFGKAIEDLTGIKGLDAAKYAAMLAAAKLAYNDAERARKEAKGWTAPSTGGYTATRGPKGTSFKKAASGGVMSLGMAKGRYLGGITDGMADKVPAHIDNKRPAALSDGEFVIPADVVSHLGNGNSNAGAKRLYKMMDDIREARTGNREQGVQINPNKFMPR